MLHVDGDSGRSVVPASIEPWPTGPGRTEVDQSEALSAIVNTVANLRGKLSVTHGDYLHFAMPTPAAMTSSDTSASFEMTTPLNRYTTRCAL